MYKQKQESTAATDRPCAACRRLKSPPQDMSTLTSELRLKYRTRLQSSEPQGTDLTSTPTRISPFCRTDSVLVCSPLMYRRWKVDTRASDGGCLTSSEMPGIQRVPPLRTVFQPLQPFPSPHNRGTLATAAFGHSIFKVFQQIFYSKRDCGVFTVVAVREKCTFRTEIFTLC